MFHHKLFKTCYFTLTAIKADAYCNDNFFTAFEVALEEKSIDIAKMITFHEN